MKVRLKKIVLQNFKAVHSMEQNFDGSQVLVTGGNGTGKTTFYEAYYWCLFGKTVTPNGTVQTLDSDNNVVHKIETSVELVLNINDEYDVTIKRAVSEKWTAAGTAEERCEGNETTCYWNGAPISVTKFKQKIAEIAPVETWQLMSNIYSFMAMKMEDRRKYLINVAGGVNEDELMKPYPALLEAKASRKSIDELLSQTKTELKKAKKEIDDIPTQIKAQDALKVSDEKDICIDEDAIKDYYEKKNLLNDKIATKRKELEENKSKRRQDACQKQYSLSDEVNRKKRLINKLLEDSVERMKSIDEIKQQLADLKLRYNEINNQQFEFTSDEICPVCGSKLSDEFKFKVREKAVAEFNNNKSNMLAKVTKEATTLSQRKAAISSAENEYRDIIKQREENALKQLEDNLSKANIHLNSINDEVVDKHPDMLELNHQLVELENKRPANTDEVTKIQANKEINRRVEAEKERLNKRSAELATIITRCDSILSQIKKYKRAKVDFIEGKVNSLFRLVKWKFYAQNLTNDDEQEICTCIVNGTDFVNLNQAMKINSLIDIINGLSKATDIFVPMWVDGSESISYPESSFSQQILLSVRDNEKLDVKIKSL